MGEVCESWGKSQWGIIGCRKGVSCIVTWEALNALVAVREERAIVALDLSERWIVQYSICYSYTQSQDVYESDCCGIFLSSKL